MSTLAVWLFVALGVLLIVMIVFVVLAGLSTVRKGRRLGHEVQGLQRDVGEAVGSAGEPREEDD